MIALSPGILLVVSLWLFVAPGAGADCSRCPAASCAPNTKPCTHDSVAEGLASFYGRALEGQTTAAGTTFDPDAMIAAHPSYPFDTVVCITNLENGRSVKATILDRGPAADPRAEGVIIDLSRRAFQEIASLDEGRVRVRVKVLRWGA